MASLLLQLRALFSFVVPQKKHYVNNLSTGKTLEAFFTIKAKIYMFSYLEVLGNSVLTHECLLYENVK